MITETLELESAQSFALTDPIAQKMMIVYCKTRHSDNFNWAKDIFNRV